MVPYPAQYTLVPSTAMLLGKGCASASVVAAPPASGALMTFASLPPVTQNAVVASSAIATGQSRPEASTNGAQAWPQAPQCAEWFVMSTLASKQSTPGASGLVVPPVAIWSGPLAST